MSVSVSSLIETSVVESWGGEPLRIPKSKITIPSDLRFHPQALSVNVGNPCGSPSPRSKGPRRARPFRASATTLKFRTLVSTPCEASTILRTREFQLQPLGIGPGCCQPSGCDTTIRNFFVNKKVDA